MKLGPKFSICNVCMYIYNVYTHTHVKVCVHAHTMTVCVITCNGSVYVVNIIPLFDECFCYPASLVWTSEMDTIQDALFFSISALNFVMKNRGLI